MEVNNLHSIFGVERLDKNIHFFNIVHLHRCLVYNRGQCRYEHCLLVKSQNVYNSCNVVLHYPNWNTPNNVINCY